MKALFDHKPDLLERFKAFVPDPVRAYYEPFVGSGTMLGYVLENRHPKEVCISDPDPVVMNFWYWLKHDWKLLYGLIVQEGDHYFSLAQPQRVERHQILKERPPLYEHGEPEDAAVFYFLRMISDPNILPREPWWEVEEFEWWGEHLQGSWMACCDWERGVSDPEFFLGNSFVFMDVPEEVSFTELVDYARTIPDHSTVLLTRGVLSYYKRNL